MSERKLWTGAVLALGVALAVTSWRLSVANAAKTDAQFERDRIAALADTTRIRVLTDSVGALGQVLAEWRRRATQDHRPGSNPGEATVTTGEAHRQGTVVGTWNARRTHAVRTPGVDSSARGALTNDGNGTERYEPTTPLPPVDTSGGRTTTSPPGAPRPRAASFDWRSEPYRLHADFEVPAGDSAPRATFDVKLDPATIHVEVRCGKVVGGVRPAEVVATGPAWLDLKVGSASVDRDQCNPTRHGRSTWWWPVVGGAAGALTSAARGDSPWTGAVLGGGVGFGLHLTFR